MSIKVHNNRQLKTKIKNECDNWNRREIDDELARKRTRKSNMKKNMKTKTEIEDERENQHEKKTKIENRTA